MERIYRHGQEILIADDTFPAEVTYWNDRTKVLRTRYESVSMHEINIPEVHGEVSDAFERYEQALVGNDITVLDELFWRSPFTLRYGAGENLYGYEAIQAFRSQRPVQGLERILSQTMITTFGRDFAVANTLFHRDGQAAIGRQSQAWVRMDEGWRIVSAHVSLMTLGKPESGARDRELASKGGSRWN